jgi:hypothetical protein
MPDVISVNMTEEELNCVADALLAYRETQKVQISWSKQTRAADMLDRAIAHKELLVEQKRAADLKSRL